FGLLLTALVYIGITLLGPIFAAFVLLLIKIIIIIFIFIMFALLLLSAFITFLIIAVVISIIALVSNQYIAWGLLYIEFNLWDIPGKYEIRVEWIDNDFLGIPVPKVVTDLIIAGRLVSRESEIPGLGVSTSDDMTMGALDLIFLDPPGPDEPVLDPLTGDSTTIFTFRIKYTGSNSEDPIIKLHLYHRTDGTLSSSEIVMDKEDPSDMNYEDGVIYTYSVSGLSPTLYWYYITASTTSEARYPAEGLIMGPIFPSISAIYLDKVGEEVLSPGSGDHDTDFTFEIKYAGPDLPSDPSLVTPVVTLYLFKSDEDGEWQFYNQFIMVKKDESDNTYSDGVIYQIQLSGLNPGTYQYYIDAKLDSSIEARYPIIGALSGPSVTRFSKMEIEHFRSVAIFTLFSLTYASLALFAASKSTPIFAWLAFGLIIAGLALSLGYAFAVPIESGGIEIITILFVICMVIYGILDDALDHRALTVKQAKGEIKRKIFVYLDLVAGILTIVGAFAGFTVDVLKFDRIITLLTVAEWTSMIILAYGVVIISPVVVGLIFGKQVNTAPMQQKAFKMGVMAFFYFAWIMLIIGIAKIFIGY
ncbi:MAG: hypothetical protein ACTSQI_21530, partial [Candidatus Helarchaeota archaeon]